jgi:o-succinylbenzoate synthase
MPIAIQSLVLREIRLPLREPFRISSGVVSERRIPLLQLRDQEGRECWSECVAAEKPNYSAETVDTAWFALREWLAPRILGRPFTHPSQVSGMLSHGVRGHLMARAAIEMGCWALAAEAEELPMATYIGGTRERVETGISLGIEPDPAALVEKALRARASGYRKIKLKIQPGSDVAFVQAVREALGPEVALMVDANSAYTPADAEHLVRLDACDLIMIEQPLAHDDLVRHAALQKRLSTPLCLDESITGVDRAEDMLALGAGRIINIKPGRVGGFGPSISIHDLCQQAGVPVWCGGMLESGIGRAYNVALASLPGFTLPGDLSPSARYWARDIVDPEWTMDDEGFVTVPRATPGLGISVDLDRIEDLTVRREVLTS